MARANESLSPEVLGDVYMLTGGPGRREKRDDSRDFLEKATGTGVRAKRTDWTLQKDTSFT